MKKAVFFLIALASVFSCSKADFGGGYSFSDGSYPKTESGWAHATADGVTGWCSEEYLSEEMPEVKPKEETELSEEDRGKLVEPSTRIKSGHHGVVDSEGGLNLRCGPGQEYDILLVIPHESEVVEEGREGDWIFVKYKGQYGWVNNEYIAPMEAD